MLLYLEKQTGIFIHINRTLFLEKRPGVFIRAGVCIRIKTVLKKEEKKKKEIQNYNILKFY